MKTKLEIRIPVYFIGLFIMTIGIALSVKSNLGVSPVSSIPYTMTCILGIEMGNATILFHICLVLIQILLLRHNFQKISFMQIAVGIIFGKFTTLCNTLVTFLVIPDNIAVRLGLTLLSVVFVAIGIFFYMPANIMPLAGEGVMQAVSEVTKIPFAKVKIGFDVSMVIISLTSCLILIHSIGSVGAGTIISAFLVGIVLGIITKFFGEWRDHLLEPSEALSECENC